MIEKQPVMLSDAQLRAEIEACEYCEEKPCRAACPVDCSPADFIMAARCFTPADFARSTSLILSCNPLGGTCGATCPDSFCVQACTKRTFNHAVRIQPVQAAIVERGRLSGMPLFEDVVPNGRRIAIIGSGPAGLGAAAVLARLGYSVTIYEQAKRPGGMALMIPGYRLDRCVLDADIEGIVAMGDVTMRCGIRVDDPVVLMKENGYEAVIVAVGRQHPLPLLIPAGGHAIDWMQFLAAHGNRSLAGKRVAIIGCGAIAVDCAVTAKLRKADHVEILYRRNFENAPIGEYERNMLFQAGVAVSACVRVDRLRIKGGNVEGVMLRRVMLPPRVKPKPSNFIPVPNESAVFRAFDIVVAAIGSTPMMELPKHKRVFATGDFVHGESTVVQAVAAGKNTAMTVHAVLTKSERPGKEKGIKSRVVLAGRSTTPVPLKTDFFGRMIRSPFILSAAPHTDGYDQVRTAYEAGWAGAVMKTAFDGVPVMIPADYMCMFDRRTYGNCDNVSGHPLDRVCKEIEKLVKEFPDRLTIGSTGGPVTGNDDADSEVWQSNTRKLEGAGAMAVEYSLSCPQGGDGMKGDMVSQDAELTAKVIRWVLEKSNPNIPKLFKLSGAVTSIRAILTSVAEVFDSNPEAFAGITLANSFPTLHTRSTGDGKDRHIIVGMSGGGVFPISCLTIAKAADMGITISGNGGAMDYRDAARFMALGAGTVQFCTLVMRGGYGIVDDLHSGLSRLMFAKGMKSTRDLIGSSLPSPITNFDKLPSLKRVPELVRDLCERCGNCTRCPYQAITMGAEGLPVIQAASCIGCSLCTLKCFAGALRMRDRTKRETAEMKEK